MYRKIAAVGVSALILTGCVTPAGSETVKANTAFKVTNVNMVETITVKNKVQMKAAMLLANTKKLNGAIKKLKTTVGKTWYVFSGSTPSGWDCSGLVMWTYKQMGIDIEHRASKQQNAGKKVQSPKIGDIVVFTYNGLKSAYHVGIYAGNGNMIHAPKHGHVTRVESVEKFAGKYSKISFVRVLETV